MAITRTSIILLLRESKRMNFQGSILQLGRQEVWTNKNELTLIAEKEKYALCQNDETYNLKKSKFVDFMCMDDVSFFKMLGFSSVHSIDVDDFEAAEILWDLNLPITKELEGKKYDVIYDGGTLEHIFHLPNVLENLHKLLNVGGRIIHSSPVDMFNHGFYNFSPCLFEDFYSTNNYIINECAIIKKRYDPVNKNFNGTAYYTDASRHSQFIRSLNLYTFDGAVHLLNFIATKTVESTGNKVPIQGYYIDAFSPNKSIGNDGLVSGNTPMKLIYAKLKLVPILNIIVRYLRDAYARSLVNWESI